MPYGPASGPTSGISRISTVITRRPFRRWTANPYRSPATAQPDFAGPASIVSSLTGSPRVAPRPAVTVGDVIAASPTYWRTACPAPSEEAPAGRPGRRRRPRRGDRRSHDGLRRRTPRRRRRAPAAPTQAHRRSSSAPTGRASSPRRWPRSWACHTDKVTAALEKVRGAAGRPAGRVRPARPSRRGPAGEAEGAAGPGGQGRQAHPGAGRRDHQGRRGRRLPGPRRPPRAGRPRRPGRYARQVDPRRDPLRAPTWRCPKHSDTATRRPGVDHRPVTRQGVRALASGGDRRVRRRRR